MDTLAEIPNGLYLHLGAHRTGTSSFQAFLGRNRGRLRDDFGIQPLYPGRDGAKRGRLRLRLPGRKHFRQNELGKFEAWLDEEMERHEVDFARPVLLSEENIVGNLGVVMRRQFYEGAGQRVRFLVERLDQPVRAVFFTLRGYDGFFTSTYRKRIEENAVHPFQDYEEAVCALKKSWADLVAELRDAAGAERFYVRLHEQPMTDVAQLRLLVPQLPETGWNRVKWQVNASKPLEELEAIQTRYWQDAHGAPAPGLGRIGFDDAQIRKFQARYDADLKEIAEMDGVTLIR